MIPAGFDYVAPASLDEALSALADGGEDAKVLAGGHSLIPLMKLRFAAPSLLVDLRRLPGMRGVARTDGVFAIGGPLGEPDRLLLQQPDQRCRVSHRGRCRS